MMKAVDVSEPGGPEKLIITEKPRPELRPNEILIKIYATAINRADTLQVRRFILLFFFKLV